MQVLEMASPAKARTEPPLSYRGIELVWDIQPDENEITDASMAAAAKVLAAMTPAQRDALRASIYRRIDADQRRRDDFALHLQIKANPQHWL